MLRMPQTEKWHTADELSPPNNTPKNVQEQKYKPERMRTVACYLSEPASANMPKTMNPLFSRPFARIVIAHQL